MLYKIIIRKISEILIIEKDIKVNQSNKKIATLNKMTKVVINLKFEDYHS